MTESMEQSDDPRLTQMVVANDELRAKLTKALVRAVAAEKHADDEARVNEVLLSNLADWPDLIKVHQALNHLQDRGGFLERRFARRVLKAASRRTS